tara:strand:- start:1114 stop:1680 length:567 start_codon:yes stop_codon:yes gene_type:complete
MPAMWPVAESILNQWFNGMGEGGEDQSFGADTASQIASAYDTAIKTASIVGKGNIVSGGVIIPSIEGGFAACFAQMASSPVDLSIAPYMSAAGGVVAAWAAPVYIPVPPHPPCIAPLVGVQQLFPGVPMPLAVEIMDAFTQEDAGQIAPLLIKAFKNHMKQITGIYLGLIPSAPSPIPGPPLPWVGVE